MPAKKGFAVEFINRIRTMDPAELNALIVREAGEELAQFFLSYSASLISRDPEKVLERADKVDEEVQKLVEDEKVTPEVAAQLQPLVDDLRDKARTYAEQG